MDITICIGSSCHLKGSKDIIQILERLIAMYNLKDKVVLKGSFCMGRCTEGVCVKVGEDFYSLSPADTEGFFKSQVLGRLES